MKRTHILNSIIVFAALLMCSAVSTAQQTDISKPDSLRDMRIRLQAYTFDPLKQMPSIEQRLLLRETRRETIYRLLQFKGPLTRKQMELLKSQYNLRLDRYIPNYTYLEKVSPAQVDSLQKLTFYRWIGNYEPAYKLDPTIGKRTFITENRRAEEGFLFVVILFEPKDYYLTCQQLVNIGIAVVSRSEKGPKKKAEILIRIPTMNDLYKIAELSSVRYIEEFGDVTLNNGTTTWVNQTNVNNSRVVWDNDIRGEGQIIGHIDGTLDLNHCFFIDPTDNTVRPGHRKVVGFRNLAGDTADDHGTFSAGNAAGEDFNNNAYSTTPNANNGNAPRARLSHGNLYDLTFTGGTKSFLDYLYAASQDGANIHTNSWDDKSTSAYTQLSEDLDQFTWDNEDNLVIIGPDNNGTIRPPDNAKNALVVNATMQNPNQNQFSSGITMFSNDGRRKPDLMAPGASIVSADGGTQCGTRTAGGTSFAAPSVAGCAALVRQYYLEGWYPTGTRQPHHQFTPSGALLKATLINSTVDVTGIAGYPAPAIGGEGWGRLLLDNALYFQNDLTNLTIWDVRHNNGLYTGLSNNHTINIAGTTVPMKITLVWTEPAALSTTAPMINDLDLAVTAPNGDVFRGNDFTNGQSTVNGTVIDNLNNVEMVLVNTPQVGQYTIQIIGTAVNTGNPGQGYALVATADTEDPPVPTGSTEYSGRSHRDIRYFGRC